MSRRKVAIEALEALEALDSGFGTSRRSPSNLKAVFLEGDDRVEVWGTIISINWPEVRGLAQSPAQVRQHDDASLPHGQEPLAPLPSATQRL